MIDHPITDLGVLLDVETLDRNLFRGPVKPGATGRVFGGQVVAQAFMAAQRSIDDDKVAHSFHAYFLRPGNESQPIIFRVGRDFDGGSFANRRVIATQKGVALLSLTASFQRPEQGLSHTAAMPDVAAPEALPSIEALAQRDDAPYSALARAFLLQPWHSRCGRSATSPICRGARGRPRRRSGSGCARRRTPIRRCGVRSLPMCPISRC